MSFNYNFEDPTSVDTFDKLKAALKERFDELFSKGYLYKGDMGETPQIVNRSLMEKVDGVEKWSALGKSIIEAIFKDTKYYKDKKIDVSALDKDGKLVSIKPATYPWWCADGIEKYPIYPATYFVYIDSTPVNIKNNDEDWEDNSCILIPEKVDYSDYSDEAKATPEELEPTVIYHKNHIYPTFYFDPNAKGTAAGAWCWKINDIETGIPASVANNDGTVLGHMFIFKNEGGEYKYKAGVDAVNGWMTRQEMIDKELRYPINGDIGFTIKKDETSINTLQIYNFVEDDKAGTNGGAWGLGGNLISFGESFYKALWNFISSDSGVEINKGKIILAVNSGNHCIFVKNDVNKTGQTLVLMPYQGDPSEKTDFADADMWKEAKLQLNYPETAINGDTIIKGDITVNNITSTSINNSEDILCRSINASGDISVEKSISCNEFTSNNLVVNNDSIIIGADGSDGGTKVSTKVNILSDNFKVTNNFIDTKLPFTSSNNIKISNSDDDYNQNIQIHAKDKIATVMNDLDKEDSTPKIEPVVILSGNKYISPIGVTGALSNGKEKSRKITVNYTTNYTLPKSFESISLVMPNSLGITINVNGENRNGSWPYLKGGSMTLKIIADDDKEICTPHTVNISENRSSGFGVEKATKFCTIYCSFTSSELADISKKLTNNRSVYKKISITATATFNLETGDGTWGQQKTIYGAGTSCYLNSCTLNSSGGSIWSSLSYPANSSGNIFTTNITSRKINPIAAETVHICPDGILIGKAKNNSAIFYIDDKGFNIKYYRPGGKVYNILSIYAEDGKCESDVFQLKTS